MLCWAPHSTSPAAIAPDCEIRARSPAGRQTGRETGVDVRGGKKNAEAVWPYQANAIRARGADRDFRKRSGAMAKPGRKDDGHGTTLGAARSNDIRHLLGRGSDHDEIRCLLERINRRGGRHSFDLAVPRIDQKYLAGIICLSKITSAQTVRASSHAGLHRLRRSTAERTVCRGDRCSPETSEIQQAVIAIKKQPPAIGALAAADRNRVGFASPPCGAVLRRRCSRAGAKPMPYWRSGYDSSGGFS